jgi:hypothetical protein
VVLELASLELEGLDVLQQQSLFPDNGAGFICGPAQEVARVTILDPIQFAGFIIACRAPGLDCGGFAKKPRYNHPAALVCPQAPKTDIKLCGALVGNGSWSCKNVAASKLQRKAFLQMPFLRV